MYYGKSILWLYYGLYADDLVLLSVSVTEMQTMIDICVDKLRVLDMTVNPGKCCIVRVGSRFDKACSDIKIENHDSLTVALLNILRCSTVCEQMPECGNA
jgi:hypothetical protein